MSAEPPRVRAGLIAGADRTGTIVLVRAGEAERTDRSGPLTVRDAIATLRAADVRLIVAELADNPEHADLAEALTAHGFHEAGRLADYVDDGVDLRILQLKVS